MPSLNRLSLPVCLVLATFPLAGLGQQQHNRENAVQAGQITTASFHRAIRGSSAIGGLGDWMLSNGTLCATISDPDHETYLSWRGGTLVDLGYCGRNDDRWSTYHELFNLSREKILPATNIEPLVGGHSAALVVTGRMAGVENRTVYRLDLEHPEELWIETTLTRVEASEPLDLFGALVLHPHRSLTPFVLSTATPQYSKGFQHPYADTHDKMAMMHVMLPADLHVLVGSELMSPEISYGVQSLSVELVTQAGQHIPLRQFAINDEEFTLIGNFTAPLWFDTDDPPGLMQFTQSRIMDLRIGDSLVTKKRILVSARADVASITNRIYTGKWLHGRITNTADRILVTDEGNHPLTFIKPENTGEFALRAPANLSHIKLVLQQEGRDNALQIPVDLDSTTTITVQSPPVLLSTVQLPPHRVMRLVFKGRHGTTDPLLFPDKLDFHVGDKRFETDITSNSISLAGIEADIHSIAIPPGDYDVYATRGPEYSLEKTTLTTRIGETQTLQIAEPHRVLESAGWISADFHVHSGFSFDSSLPSTRRVIDFIAQGGEVLVPTEHKRTVDYAPVIRALGVQGLITTLTGVELTGMAHTEIARHTIGHANVFPLTAHDDRFLGGTLPHEHRRMGEVIDEYKRMDRDVIFQLNHPRYHPGKTDDMNFLDHLSIGKSFDPTLPLDAPVNASLLEHHEHADYRDIDFDAMELLNGADMVAYQLVRQDWLSLMLQGYRKTATADSDSHNTREIVAMPRNYVHVAHDRIAEFNKQELVSAVRRGDVFGTTGPLLQVTLNGKGMGELFRGHNAVLDVAVQAADWVPLEKLVVTINGKLWKEIPCERGHRYKIPIHVERDSFVTVEASGEAAGDYAAAYPGFTPFAFSNPIFIDANGDGKWTAPGL